MIQLNNKNKTFKNTHKIRVRRMDVLSQHNSVILII